MKNESRSEIIHDALNMLDDDMIEEVEKLRGGVVEEKNVASTTDQLEEDGEKKFDVKKKARPWRKWTALAASICLLMICGSVWEYSLNKNADEIGKLILSEEEGLPQNASAIVIPPYIVDLAESKEGMECDMLAFFIHEGRCYVQNEYIKNGANIVGDYVGASKGLIDEWTMKDGYVNGAGSVAGDFYEVKGMNPDFMLCMKYEDGAVETFVNDNGICLSKGSDLLEERLYFSKNEISVGFLDYHEWNYTTNEPQMLSDEYDEVFERFIDSFNEAEFMFLEDTPFDTEELYNNDAVYHLYFVTENGVKLQFWLFEDGYVSFHGLNQVCVQIDEKIYNEIIEILKNE